MDTAHTLGGLRQTLARLDSVHRPRGHAMIDLGAQSVDAALGGGLARGALHDIFPRAQADMAAASGFVLGLCLRLGNGPMVWVRQRRAETETGRVYAQGLAEMGLGAGQMILVRVDSIAAALRAGRDALGCTALGAVVLETWGASRHLDLTASRRLALAAAQSGVTGFMVQAGTEPVPSAAMTRWRVGGAVSIDSMDLPGQARFSVELLRQKGRPGGALWHLEWNHEHRIFADETLSGAVVPAFANRPAAKDRGTARAGTG